MGVPMARVRDLTRASRSPTPSAAIAITSWSNSSATRSGAVPYVTPRPAGGLPDAMQALAQMAAPPAADPIAALARAGAAAAASDAASPARAGAGIRRAAPRQVARSDRGGRAPAILGCVVDRPDCPAGRQRIQRPRRLRLDFQQADLRARAARVQRNQRPEHRHRPDRAGVGRRRAAAMCHGIRRSTSSCAPTSSGTSSTARSSASRR